MNETPPADGEIRELQARMAAVELLLTDLLAQASAEKPALKSWLEQREKTTRLILDGEGKRATTVSTHVRYLECVLMLLREVRSRSTLFEPEQRD